MACKLPSQKAGECSCTSLKVCCPICTSASSQVLRVSRGCPSLMSVSPAMHHMMHGIQQQPCLSSHLELQWMDHVVKLAYLLLCCNYVTLTMQEALFKELELQLKQGADLSAQALQQRETGSSEWKSQINWVGPPATKHTILFCPSLYGMSSPRPGHHQSRLLAAGRVCKFQW